MGKKPRGEKKGRKLVPAPKVTSSNKSKKKAGKGKIIGESLGNSPKKSMRGGEPEVKPQGLPGGKRKSLVRGKHADGWHGGGDGQDRSGGGKGYIKRAVKKKTQTWEKRK